MIDRNDVIRRFTQYIEKADFFYAYWMDCKDVETLNDALELLKVQEKIINEYIEKTGYLPKAWYKEVIV